MTNFPMSKIYLTNARSRRFMQTPNQTEIKKLIKQ